MFSNIGVVGAGAMGTAISQTICENAQNVLLYARRENVVNTINETRFNKDYFPNIRLQDNIVAINDLNKLKDAEIIFLTLPSSTIRSMDPRTSTSPKSRARSTSSARWWA